MMPQPSVLCIALLIPWFLLELLFYASTRALTLEAEHICVLGMGSERIYAAKEA